jgi:hypothetical protein
MAQRECGEAFMKDNPDTLSDMTALLERAATVAELEEDIVSCLRAADELRLWQTGAYLDSARLIIRKEAKIESSARQP